MEKCSSVFQTISCFFFKWNWSLVLLSDGYTDICIICGFSLFQIVGCLRVLCRFVWIYWLIEQKKIINIEFDIVKVPFSGQDPGVCGVWHLILQFWFKYDNFQIISRITQTCIDQYLELVFKPTPAQSVRPTETPSCHSPLFVSGCAGIAGIPAGYELRRGSVSSVACKCDPPSGNWICLIDPRSPLFTVEPPSTAPGRSGILSAVSRLRPRRWMSSRDEANNREGEGWNFDRAAERHGFSDHR